jgi:CheY-like chemotaxis protein
MRYRGRGRTSVTRFKSRATWDSFERVPRSTIPVVAVTASVMAQERHKVMAAGFDGFQGKPISVREPLETAIGFLTFFCGSL